VGLVANLQGIAQAANIVEKKPKKEEKKAGPVLVPNKID